MDAERILGELICLLRKTDNEHYVTVNEIQDFIEDNFELRNVSCITIRRDIERLTNMGENIVVKAKRHNRYYYSLKRRAFSLNEVRFIIDSISINKFLTYKQKTELIHKFEFFCSDGDVHKLLSRVVVNDVSRPRLDLLENLDIIHTLISEKRRINFEYGKFDTDKQMKYYQKKRKVLPVQVEYFKEHFYLRCFDEIENNWRTYRVDRMCNITRGEIDSTIVHMPEKHKGFVADIYEPDFFTVVKLRVKKYLLDGMVEYFGDYATVCPDNENNDSVIMNVSVGINRHFYLWLLHYGNGVEVLSPENIRKAIADEIKSIYDMYKDVNKD